jgi:CheY-like chemotaxis protein/HPt (histidine-containing phosphotransfer) domain-containing protein
LAISKRIVDRMGGSIDLESREGEGSSFWFEVPLTRLSSRSPAASAEAKLPAAAATDGSCTKSALRILVAEDNVINQQVTLGILASFGCRADLARDGSEAVSMVRQGNYDLVLMDYQMPVMDGLAATRAIRALPIEQHAVAIIALTASSMTGDRTLCLVAGMDDYIDKPLDRARLAALLDRWAERLMVGETARLDRPALVKAPAIAGSAEPLPLIERATLEKIATERGRDTAKNLARLFAEEFSLRVAEMAAAVKAQDFGKVAATAHNLHNAAAELGFARLGRLLADLDHRARHSAPVAEEIVAEAGQLGQRTIEVARLVLDA